MLDVIAVSQHVAPAPHACMFGTHVKIVMQIPTPLEDRSKSQEVPVGH
jgi:hypothetical protein